MAQSSPWGTAGTSSWAPVVATRAVEPARVPMLAGRSAPSSEETWKVASAPVTAQAAATENIATAAMRPRDARPPFARF